MDRSFESGASATPPTQPASPSNGYPSPGNPGSGTQATKPGPWWYYMVTEEIRKVLIDAGLTPDYANTSQLSQAIQSLISQNLGIPQNSKSANYTTVLSDAQKHILHPSADTTARTFTIPANASVAYPIGTALTFVNQASAGVLTIAINTDTMRLAGSGATGSRTLAANGIATALKITATEWLISGTGLS